MSELAGAIWAGAAVPEDPQPDSGTASRSERSVRRWSTRANGSATYSWTVPARTVPALWASSSAAQMARS